MTITPTFTKGSALVTMPFRAKTTHRHTHTVKIYCLNQSIYHTNITIRVGSIPLIKAVSRESETYTRLFLFLHHFKLTHLHQRENRLE